MPYSSKQELPSSIKKMPEHAQAIWMAAFNSAAKQYEKEEQAFATAMSAVKRKYKKKGDRWISKDGVNAMPFDKEFSAERRKELAKQGKAMPSGSFPIENRADLGRAIQAFGRAGNKPAAKAWIKKRARELGATEMLPENWDAAGLAAKPRKLHDAWMKTEEFADASVCPDCDGDGVDDDEEVCETCGGEGYVGLPASAQDRRKPPDDDDDDDEDEEDDEDQEDCGPMQRRAKDGSIRLRMTDKATLDGSNIHRTKNGFLVANARIARTGIQLYAGSEVGSPTRDVVRVYRPPEEVFDKRAMHSMAHMPVTLDHPERMVDKANWKEHSIGHTVDPVARDGEFIRVPVMICDAKAIEAYERSGVGELSVGYSTDLKWQEGTAPNGEKYDAIQTRIRGNHLAVVPSARGGSNLRIGDNQEDGPMIKVLVDGQSIEFASELAAKHVTDHIASLQKLIADAKKRDDRAEEEQEAEKKERAEKDAAFAALKGEVAVLKKQIEDSAAKIDDAVSEKIDLLIKADAAMEGKGSFNAKQSAAEIRRVVVAAKMGDAAKALTDAEMVGAFKAVTSNVKARSGAERLADSLSMLGHGGGSNQNDPKAIRDAAYAEYVNKLQSAWKTPQRTA